MANWIRIAIVTPPRRAFAAEGGHGNRVAGVLSDLREAVAPVLADSPDLIVLPELFDLEEGEPLEHYLRFCEQSRESVVSGVTDLARAWNCHLTLPTMLDHGCGWQNSVQWITPTGRVLGGYAKSYPVIEEMQEGVVPGDGPRVWNTPWGSVGATICFDLNYNALRAQLAELQPRLILFPSMYHGGSVQKAWAMDCRSYFVGCISGLPSAVISPQGQALATTTQYTDHVVCDINLDYALVHLSGNVEKLRALKDTLGRGVSLVEPGLLGTVLVSSDTPGRSIEDILGEFEVESYDAYLQRAGDFRRRALPSMSADQTDQDSKFVTGLQV